MTNEQILKKAIEKAMRGGWKDTVIGVEEMFGEAYDAWWLGNNHYFMFLFSHDFAKAFWGEEEITVEDINPYSGANSEGVTIGGQIIAYEYHLQQLVLEKKPLKYLEKFL